MEPTNFLLTEKDIPTAWYNIQADLPDPVKPMLQSRNGRAPWSQRPRASVSDGAHRTGGLDRTLHRRSRSGSRCLPPVEADTVVPCETSGESSRDACAHLLQVRRCERRRSHKPNTAVAQAYYNQQEGVARLTTETGAGQWGSALAFSCNFFDLECKVYMVKVSYEQKPYRRSMMQSWGASVVASPSNETNAGRQTLERDPPPRTTRR